MASGIYNRFKANLMRKLHDMVNDTIKVALYGASAAFTATDTAYTTTNEIAGSGYAAGGQALAGNAIAEGASAVFTASNTAWAASTFSAFFAVLYDQTPCNTLICMIDFGGVQTVSNGTFTIQYASSGIIRLT